ncbi:MAG: hypothetical protein R3321_14715, partial [Nitrososphaeraceae archaeon]|nr:hypothetical protein [Nitrososphaeraceae archaeon]
KLNCMVLNTSHVLKIEIRSFECDSKTGRQLDGILKARLVNKFIENGHRRGIHFGTFEWYGFHDFIILGRLDGITNSGSHHDPLPKCEKCNQDSHLEGRLDGYIKFQNASDSMYGYKISAMYAIDIDWRVKSEPFRQDNYGNMKGSIEGIISHFCNEL